MLQNIAGWIIPSEAKNL